MQAKRYANADAYDDRIHTINKGGHNNSEVLHKVHGFLLVGISVLIGIVVGIAVVILESW